MPTTQKEEIETIKEREFKIELSDADIKRIYEKAGSVGMTPSELLANFIGDLVDGTLCNSDHNTRYANQWFKLSEEQDCKLSFLSWLIDYDMADYIADMYNDIISFDREQFLLEYGSDETAEAEEELKEFKAEIMKSFNEYCKSNSRAETLEEEMKLVMKWYEDFKKHKVF